ncbi:hypothetical protein AURDEDRAFT_177559 [Auricularia subglabra TFB-10046 SS5]|uniref:Uncharacterized protein n=1 Tax=Auricularia subglabra (strain TFB-10046 / SS5) TaxID=717982 RepID=J0D3U3_AURST|nr:hypothetical protein AURDEDRAFT_177559 [Auricularia subglabra TFB-10046 SS5]
MKKNKHGLSYLECELRADDPKNHLILRNLQEYDIDYLQALVLNDTHEISSRESAAAAKGYGPLVPCHHTRSPRSQSQLCPHPHRAANGSLQPGLMIQRLQCQARFRVYEPHDLAAHPFILVVCSNPHSHPPPERSMTPPLLREALNTALLNMRWQLADATPRRLALDSGFMATFRQILNWGDTPDDPTLSDLHPSLGNLDHTAILIDAVRKPVFPHGVDFEGAKDLLQKQRLLAPEQQYVRFADEVLLPDKPVPEKMVICMFPSQSERLLDAKRIEVDISFKRVSNWYEFQMVTWDAATSQSVTLCRAFTTSTSASAHHELYRQIFKIAYNDTGRHPRFHYLHGDGYEIWTTDDDRGHALGLGQFLVEIAQDLTAFDRYEPGKRLCDLGPYEHLARFLRLCVVHLRRNIKRYQGKVSKTVYDAMWSLAASETHTDFPKACEIIRTGGKDAANWLREKELFALAALYQPWSKIPLEIWRAGKGNTNGVEQMHRDVNRDGKWLTLLGGIQRGMQHDIREAKNMSLVRSEGIHRRFKPSEPVFTQKRSIQRSVRAEKRRLESAEQAPSDNAHHASTGRKRRAQSLPAGTSALPTTTTSSSSYLTTTPIPIRAPVQTPHIPEAGQHVRDDV